MTVFKPPLFGSLGSHFTGREAGQALLAWAQPRPEAERELKQALSDYFARERRVTGLAFTYQGRDALELALRALGVRVGDGVLTQAFACASIEAAIGRLGAQTVYLDLAPGRLAPSPSEADQAYRVWSQSYPAMSLKVLILQGSLGTVESWVELIGWAHERGLLVIADLAQALGGKLRLEQGSESELFAEADAVILSSGRDKVWDAVAGGAVVMLAPHHLEETLTASLRGTGAGFPPVLNWRLLSYPALTWLIRRTYAYFFGRVLLWGARQLGWITSPLVCDFPRAVAPSSALLSLMARRWNEWPAAVARSRRLARHYHRALAKFSPWTEVDVEQGSCLRYPVYVREPQLILTELAKRGIYLTDRWYRAPVDSGRVAFTSSYQVASCPVAEWTAKHLLNLPTHAEVTPARQAEIIELVRAHAQPFPSSEEVVEKGSRESKINLKEEPR